MSCGGPPSCGRCWWLGCGCGGGGGGGGGRHVAKVGVATVDEDVSLKPAALDDVNLADVVDVTFAEAKRETATRLVKR